MSQSLKMIMRVSKNQKARLILRKNLILIQILMVIRILVVVQIMGIF